MHGTTSFAAAAAIALAAVATPLSAPRCQSHKAADTRGGSKPDGAVLHQLFNGKDLEGWTPKITGYAAGENFADTFRVVDGLLTVSYEGYEGRFKGRFGHLFHKLEFANYRLRTEYRFVGDQIDDGPGWAFRNSGLMLHGQTPASMQRDQKFPASIEVQLLGARQQGERPTVNLCTPGTHVVRNGKLWTQHCLNSTSQSFRGDEWVTVEVEVRGSTIRHIVDGHTVLTYDDPQLDPRDGDAKRLLKDGRDKALRHGTISLQSESHPVQFRKVELLELNEPKPWREPLSSAKLETNFATKGNWSLADGKARLTPRDGESGWRRFDHYLWLTESDSGEPSSFGEFDAEFDYKLQASGNSGFYFHVGDRSRPVGTGIEVQLFATEPGKKKLTDHDAGGIIPGGPPSENAANPVGEWNHMHVRCEAGQILVTLNGRLVHTMPLDHKRIADRPAAGAIGFQDHSLPLEIRRLRIRSL
ncbi:MAG: DUF1080 domain-containing protein [Planctomycetota bacterium]